MTFVEAREGESFDQLVRRFKTSIDKAGVLREFRRRTRFIPESERRRLKARAAAIRRRANARRHRRAEE